MACRITPHRLRSSRHGLGKREPDKWNRRVAARSVHSPPNDTIGFQLRLQCGDISL